MSVCMLGTHSEFRFKVQTLCLSKGMSRQLEISLVSPECVHSFPDSQEYVGAYQGLLWLSYSLGHPVKFLGDFMIAPHQYCSFSFRQLWCWSSSVVSVLRWLWFYVFIFKSGQPPLSLEQLFFTAFSDCLGRITLPRTLMGQGTWVPRWILQTLTVFTVCSSFLNNTLKFVVCHFLESWNVFLFYLFYLEITV